jgi:CIC family chloride channel protein
VVSDPPPSAQPNVAPPGRQFGTTFRFWVAVVITGLVSGMAAVAIKEVLRSVQHFSYSYSSGEFVDAVQKSSDGHRIVVLAIAGALAGGIWYLLERIAGTRGGDISDVVWSGDPDMPVVPTLVTATLSETIIALGASLGREEPPKEAAAALTSLLTARMGLSRDERRALVAFAAGAGWAAMYNIPLGGAVFALEVFLGTVTFSLVLPAVATSSIAVAISWTVEPIHPYFPSIPTYPITTSLIVWAIVAGPIIGLVTVGFIWILGWVQRHKVGGKWLLVGPLLFFTVLGALAITYPQLLGNGKDIAEQVFLGGMSIPLIVALVVLKPLVTAGCIGSGATGGLFTPTTSTGALLGALLGNIWSLAWPGTAHGAFALVGATAMLGAAMNGPVSALVLMVELTHHMTNLLVPAILALVGACLVTRAFHACSIYSVRLPRGHAPQRWATLQTGAGETA